MAKKKSALDKLTFKQRTFLKRYLETGEVVNSARAAGYATDSSGTQTLQKAPVKEAFQELLEQEGLSDKAIAKCLQEGLNATKISRSQFEGKFTDEKIDVDRATRHRYAETILKLKDKYVEKVEVQHKHSLPPVPGDVTIQDLLEKYSDAISNRAGK